MEWEDTVLEKGRAGDWWHEGRNGERGGLQLRREEERQYKRRRKEERINNTKDICKGHRGSYSFVFTLLYNVYEREGEGREAYL